MKDNKKEYPINITEADRTKNFDLEIKEEEFNEGLEGFPQEHI